MSYKALYRKWRPMIFEEVMGQEEVISTIKAQIRSNSIPHAYLFTGTRGTGKTSTAKILSRAINCLNPVDCNPCNECSICKGILDESILDIIEIDAASNNGVDDIRELRENVKYPPATAKNKVYIIDEVHMLSSGAFNALLKTLEEPPKNVIFILATTEPHKIPATILSRCQKFDFKRIDSETTLKLCLKICDSMEISYEESAINLIVKNSDGSARDALSLLDRVINGTERHITYDDTLKLLGIVVDDFLVKITDFLIEKDSKNIFISIEEFFQSGKNLNYFIKRLVYHFRNLLMGKSGVELENILNESSNYTENVKRQSQKFSTNEIIRIIDITSRLEGELKYSSQGRIAFEVAMAKIMNPIFDDSEGGLLSRIEKLEKQIKEGNFTFSNSYREDPKKKEKDNAEIKNDDIENNDFKKVVNSSKSEDFINIKNSWENLLTSIKERSVKIHAFAIEGTPVSVEEGKFILGFEDCFGFHVEMLLRPENKRIVEEVLSQKIGKSLMLECEFLSNIKEENSKDEEESKIDDVSKINEFFSEMSDKIEIIE